LAEARTELGECQVRSRTESPCLKPAEVEIRGMPFCEEEFWKVCSQVSVGEPEEVSLAREAVPLREDGEGEYLGIGE
jgi:hypothetical protein